MQEIPLTEEEIERHHEEMESTETQKQITKDIGNSLAKSLDMSPLSMRGFVALAVKDWQKMMDMTCAEAEIKLSTSTESRIKQTTEILDCFKNRVLRILKAKKKDKLLDSAIKTALDLYIEKYASRPPDI